MCTQNIESSYALERKYFVRVRYEGLPNYCLIYGKLGHVTRWCKDEMLGEMATREETEVMYAFKGLDAE